MGEIKQFPRPGPRYDHVVTIGLYRHPTLGNKLAILDMAKDEIEAIEGSVPERVRTIRDWLERALPSLDDLARDLEGDC